MSIRDTIKKSVLEGLDQGDISIGQIAGALFITMLLALFIFHIYKLVKKSGFYSHTFNVSMAVISLVTAGIILSMQSNIVISLGMVGALSIVRFRTAIKDPMDLLFLFWSIGTGIICGAGLYKIAILLALFVTISIFLFEMLPRAKAPCLLVVNLEGKEEEAEVKVLLGKYSKYYREKSRNVTKQGIDLIFEVSTGKGDVLIDEIIMLNQVSNAALLSHDGEVRA